jgi:hypothetical protein
MRDAEVVLGRDREDFLQGGLHGRPDCGKLAIVEIARPRSICSGVPATFTSKAGVLRA